MTQERALKLAKELLDSYPESHYDGDRLAAWIAGALISVEESTAERCRALAEIYCESSSVRRSIAKEFGLK